MKPAFRVALVTLLVFALAGSVQLGLTVGAGAAGPEHPTFANLTPTPFTTVEPGSVTIGAHAMSDAGLVEVTLKLNGEQIDQEGNTSAAFINVSAERPLTAGAYTASVSAVDTDGDTFQAEWDFVVSTNLGDGEWFTASGQPKANQINATLASLVQAFRWHLYGLSWDSSPHTDLPSHVSMTGMGDPVGPWVTGTTFDQAATQATLQSLVEAFRWHFWGISWDGSNHPDIPTHASTVQPPQTIEPWFTADGQAIPANISATLRSLVEAFRWHFWGYSWDGNDHPDIPTHASMTSEVPTPEEPTPETPTPQPAQYPKEGGITANVDLSAISPFSDPTGIQGSPTTAGYKFTLPPLEGASLVNTSHTYSNASYSLSVRSLTALDSTAGCLVFGANDTSSSSEMFTYCLLFDGKNAVAADAFYIAEGPSSSSSAEEDFGTWVLSPQLSATNWTTLKVIVKAKQLWFFINGNYMGTATSSSTMVNGHVGFLGLNMNPTKAETIEFKDLIIRSLLAGSTSAATGSSQTGSSATQEQRLSPSLIKAVESHLK